MNNNITHYDLCLINSDILRIKVVKFLYSFILRIHMKQTTKGIGNVMGRCTRCDKQSKTVFCDHCQMWSIVDQVTYDIIKKKKQILKMDNRDKAEKTFLKFLETKLSKKDAKKILNETMKEYDQNFLDSIRAKSEYSEKEALNFCRYILSRTPTNGASMRKIFDKLSEDLI